VISVRSFPVPVGLEPAHDPPQALVEVEPRVDPVGLQRIAQRAADDGLGGHVDDDLRRVLGDDAADRLGGVAPIPADGAQAAGLR